jgi:outer membrane protein TolC
MGTPPAPSAITQVAYQPAEPPETVAAPAATTPAGREVPINLDTVFRLAEEQNAQIALAREKLHESLTEQQLAAKGWLPNVYAGLGYYRHEGGIQNEDGTLTHSSTGALWPGLHLQTEFDLREAVFQRVNAERKLWQQRGELHKVTYETLLEAATTYLDLLTARRGAALVNELEPLQADLLRRAEKQVTPTDQRARVLVESIRAEMTGRQQALAKLGQQGAAAAAKLAYLLGLPPDALLVPAESTLTPLELVDATPPAETLVARVLTNGPGLHELDGLLAVIQGGIDQASGPQRYLPTVCVNMAEGAFGAGPGARLDWDNRWDFGIQARWNLTDWLTACEKKKLAQSRLQQVRLTQQDLRGKLAAGVQEARTAILAGQEQLRLGAEQITHAAESYRLSKLRVEQNVQGASEAEVLQSIRGLELAHFNYLSALSAYNKAQIRLLLLLGPCAGPGQ